EADLGRRADRYPNAVATRTDLLAAAQKAERAGRAAEAAARYRQLLGCLAGADDKTARAAIDGLTPRGDPTPEATEMRTNGGALSPAWRIRLGGPDEWAVLPESASPDGDVIYVAASGRIAARAVPDGRRVWERELS